MRPTRWTKQRRVTYYRKGGWHLSRYGLMYIHPATGDGYSAGWNLTKLWSMRRRREGERGEGRTE